MFPRWFPIALVFAVALVVPVRGAKSTSETSPTATLANSQSSLADRTEALAGLESARPSDEVLAITTRILLDVNEDQGLRDRAEIALIGWQYAHQVLPTRQLLAGLLSDYQQTRRTVAGVVMGSKRFPADSADIVAKASSSSDPYIHLCVAHVFVDVERLTTLALHIDGEVRSQAIGRLWDATEDVTVVLPLLWQQSQIPLPDQLAQQERQLDKRLIELRSAIQSEADDRRRELLEEQLFENGQDPVRREICKYNLRLLGIALRRHSISTEHAAKVVPFCLQCLEAESESVRRDAAGELLAIAASYNRVHLAQDEAKTRIQSRLTTEPNVEVAKTLRKILDELAHNLEADPSAADSDSTWQNLLLPSGTTPFLCPSDRGGFGLKPAEHPAWHFPISPRDGQSPDSTSADQLIPREATKR